ncbi:Crp/Fnr family transcriptional regulator [Acuticoccus mangrovi]|uniref:Crp/Fnr family transcriptional regulator n=1 Tax=Acuticoccus mangrovi TaxID=2796142 RepID=A0A934IEI3_9HYPH|nr:Crp/Fnr family transcriptional regulator [Acuticoccus mangrovi]MBJ3775129.1 Crp/Fnr family transcriptional regulator [Acuticoccus mangrovi]
MRVNPQVLSQSVTLDGLPEDLAEELIKVARTRPVKSGATLFEAGDPGDGFYALLEGSLHVVLRGEEGEQVLAILSPGAIFGELSLFDGEPRSATVVAVKASRVAFFDKGAVFRFADENPAVYRHMLCIVGRRLRVSNATLAARSLLPLTGRVAQTLLHLSDLFGKNVGAGRVLVHHKISQADLAAMVGAARENVSRVLNDWKREGHISRISGYYCIEDHAALTALATL